MTWNDLWLADVSADNPTKGYDHKALDNCTRYSLRSIKYVRTCASRRCRRESHRLLAEWLDGNVRRDHARLRRDERSNDRERRLQDALKFRQHFRRLDGGRRKQHGYTDRAGRCAGWRKRSIIEKAPHNSGAFHTWRPDVLWSRKLGCQCG
jgi:hypothetical protein